MLILAMKFFPKPKEILLFYNSIFASTDTISVPGIFYKKKSLNFEFYFEP